jgi:Putative zinc-finger
MDHDEAVRQMMVERYFLGELASDEQEAFEEHFFSCQDCALDMRSEAAFIDHSKVVLAAPVQEPAAQKIKSESRGWMAWFRPALAASVMAILLVLLGYESFIAVPSAKRLSGAPQVLPALSLISAATRGENKSQLIVHKGQPFLVFVDIPSEARFSSYTAEMFDPAGRSVWSLPVTNEAARDTVSIRIPGQQDSGTYTLVVRGIENGGNTADLARFPFELRFQD